MDAHEARRELVRLLRLAYSGELAAAIAYRGHAASVSDPDERLAVLHIERQELVHRVCIGRMLGALGERPSKLREWRMRLTGGAISLFCKIGGWFWPMYGAGRLERRNIREYEDAARAANACGRSGFVDKLLHMAEVEWDHELWFREKAASHWMWPFVPKWSAPPPREEIRASFEAWRIDAEKVNPLCVPIAR